MPIVGACIVPHPPLIVPAVGKGEEKKITRTVAAYQEVARRVVSLSPETLVITSPHATTYSDYFTLSPGSRAEGSFRNFGAPQEKFAVEYDETLVRAIAREASAAGIPAGTLGERNPSLDHGTMVPLHFLFQGEFRPKIVRIGISGLSPLEHYRFGQCLAKAVEATGERVFFVASGDLSHKLKEDGPYGFSPEGPTFDEQIVQAMSTADFGRFLHFSEEFCEKAAECGLRSFQILAGALDGKSVVPELLSHEGPFGVGYAVAAFQIGGPDSSRKFGLRFEAEEREEIDKIAAAEDPFVALARKALETFVRTGKRLPRPDDLPEPLTRERAGVFVSLKKEGRLRGCIGTISPTTACVADEILRNAVHSGTEDPRFEPVTADELPRLVYSVDVLGKAEPIASKAMLDVQRFGVIVRRGARTGLLLPNLEGVDTIDEQIGIALRKAGIGEAEPYTLERFEVIRHH